MLSKIIFFQLFCLAALSLLWGCSGSGSVGKDQTFQEIAFPTPTTTTLPSPTPTSITLAGEPTPADTPEPLEYVVEEAKGTVLLVQNGKALPVALEEEETVQEGDEIITKENSQATLSLDENTLIRLGPDSDLRLTKLGPNETNGFISRLELIGGKILSEVENLTASQSTFEVNAGGVVCGVRGTAFEVLKQGQEVHTSTFHGLVEMRKGRFIQKIKANQHLAFSFKRGSFLGKRTLNEQEKARYSDWNRHLVSYKQKAVERKQLLESLNRLSPLEKSRVLDQMRQVPHRQRLKVLNHTLHKRATTSRGQAFAPSKPVLHPNPGRKTQVQKLKGETHTNHSKGAGFNHQAGRPKESSAAGKTQGNSIAKRPMARAQHQPGPAPPKGVVEPKQRKPKREFRVPRPNGAHPNKANDHKEKKLKEDN